MGLKDQKIICQEGVSGEKRGSSGGVGAACLYKKEGFGDVGWEARIRT
ncbi:MAG: hypothetical protein PHU81_08175 [Acidobacteriota bacterium]|nr:hypothetical protein [Acidobacteriota bacterium]